MELGGDSFVAFMSYIEFSPSMIDTEIKTK